MLSIFRNKFSFLHSSSGIGVLRKSSRTSHSPWTPNLLSSFLNHNPKLKRPLPLYGLYPSQFDDYKMSVIWEFPAIEGKFFWKYFPHKQEDMLSPHLLSSPVSDFLPSIICFRSQLENLIKPTRALWFTNYNFGFMGCSWITDRDENESINTRISEEPEVKIPSMCPLFGAFLIRLCIRI